MTEIKNLWVSLTTGDDGTDSNIFFTVNKSTNNNEVMEKEIKLPNMPEDENEQRRTTTWILSNPGFTIEQLLSNDRKLYLRSDWTESDANGHCASAMVTALGSNGKAYAIVANANYDKRFSPGDGLTHPLPKNPGCGQ
ncbi:MAG: hypothetical protein P0116_16910 [Candidatus Nitrosocosmicus sp.]|nr:hypothetical protein [Candidatus Nitrosocosmicus sp.]